MGNYREKYKMNKSKQILQLENWRKKIDDPAQAGNTMFTVQMSNRAHVWAQNKQLKETENNSVSKSKRAHVWVTLFTHSVSAISTF